MNSTLCSIVELVECQAEAIPAHPLSHSVLSDMGGSGDQFCGELARDQIGDRVSLLPVPARAFLGYRQADSWQVWGLSHAGRGRVVREEDADLLMG